uniref:Transmembrane protein 231 n=1 Tax=Globodera rostochiensis TaxID=31243 RepID=A0A914I8S1_GLORO
MAPLAVVHTEPLLEEFRAPFCSTANFWRHFSAFSTTLLSILLTFASQGLWLRTNTFPEKPIVRFTENVFFLFETPSYSEKTLFWSPIAQLNEIALAKQFELLVPVIETVHSDRDGDCRADEIEIRIAFRLATNATLPPSTILEKRALVELKGAPIFGSFQSQNPFNEIDIIGDMAFSQQNLLPSYEAMDWQMRRWAIEQNFSIVLSRKAERVRMTTLQEIGEGVLFYFTFRTRIGEQIFHYRTNVWEMLKWAWIQYLALLVIVRYPIGVLSSFFYQNQIIGTFVGAAKNKMH